MLRSILMSAALVVALPAAGAASERHEITVWNGEPFPFMTYAAVGDTLRFINMDDYYSVRMREWDYAYDTGWFGPNGDHEDIPVTNNMREHFRSHNNQYKDGYVILRSAPGQP